MLKQAYAGIKDGGYGLCNSKRVKHTAFDASLVELACPYFDFGADPNFKCSAANIKSWMPGADIMNATTIAAMIESKPARDNL